MNNESNSSTDPRVNSEAQGVERLSAEKLARRRSILMGVSRGAAVLAAASPLKVLATTSSVTGNVCTISGAQSAHVSGPGKVSNCGGYSPGWWRQHYNQNSQVPSRPWPNAPVDYLDNNGHTIQKLYNVPVKKVLTNSNYAFTLFELMGNPTYSDTSERHWICAYLNALASAQGLFPSGYEFGYDYAQVISFYLDNDQDAYSFFTKYMEGFV